MDRHFHRRNLPHLYFSDGTYFITYRLANSIPFEALDKLKAESSKEKDESKRRIFKKYDSLLDSGRFGEKYLAVSKCAQIVKYTLHFLDNNQYKLICYCVMPNHVHVIFRLLINNKGISKIMQSIKRLSATDCNKVLNRKGKYWQDESFDRLIRDDKELYFTIKYVLLNPVKAGLVKNWNDWEHTYCHKDYLIF